MIADSHARELSAQLVRYAEARLHDRHDAEDVAQEVLARLAAAPAVPTTYDDQLRWCRRVAANLIVDRARRQRATPHDPATLPESADVEPSPADVAARLEQIGLGLDALRALPERQQQVLVMRYVDEHGVDTIAERLGTTSEAVRSLIARGKRGFRIQALRRGVALPGLAATLHFAKRFRSLAAGSAATAAMVLIAFHLPTLAPVPPRHALAAPPRTIEVTLDSDRRDAPSDASSTTGAGHSTSGRALAASPTPSPKPSRRIVLPEPPVCEDGPAGAVRVNCYEEQHTSMYVVEIPCPQPVCTEPSYRPVKLYGEDAECDDLPYPQTPWTYCERVEPSASPSATPR